MLAGLLAATILLGSHSHPLAGYGMRVDLPAGWRGRVSHGIVTAATFAVPAGDTGFANEAAAQVQSSDVLLAISEYQPIAGEHLLCLPRTHAPTLTLADLRKATRQRVIVPLTTLFCLSHRHFILFGRAGRSAVTSSALATVNRLLASFRVRRGDFYPGRVDPARFPSGVGWHIGTSGARADTANGEQTESYASTAPYANGPNDLPPVRSVHKLGRNGVLIWLGLSRDSRRAPPAFEHETPLPFRIEAGKIFTNWEGNGNYSRYGLYRQTAFRRGQYDLDLWVFFSAAHPSAATIARAQTEIDRVTLPHWPRF
jgi:hypothetical protein